jgi:WD40 repeat protein
MDQAIDVYDNDKGVQVDRHERIDSPGQVTCLAFSPDGRTVLSGGYSGSIQLWKMSPDGQISEAKRFSGHSSAITAIQVSQDGKFVLSGDKGKRVRFWSLDTCREQFAIEGFQWNIMACFLSRSAKQALATDSKKIDLIDISKGESIQSMRLIRGLSQSCAISRDGRYVACSEMYGLRVWEIRTGKDLPDCQDREIQWSAAFTVDGKHLLSGGNGKVNLWEVATGRKLYEFDTAASSYVQSLAISPDGKHFAAVSSNAGADVVVCRLPPEAQ